MDQLVGPALGMRFRHEVRGYAEEQQRKRIVGWHEVRLLNNSETAELIGDTTTADEAIERTESWLAGDRQLGAEPAHPHD